MFPATWAQSLHYFDINMVPQGCAYCQWWIVGGIVPPTYNYENAANAMAAWFADINRDYLVWQHASLPLAQLWMQDTHGLHQSVGNAPGAWQIGRTIPNSACMVLQKFASIPAGRSDRGRSYISQLTPTLLEGKYLSDDYLANWQSAWDTAPLGLTVDGISFAAALPNYVTPALKPIVKWIVTPRLGTVRRRANFYHHGTSYTEPRRVP